MRDDIRVWKLNRRAPLHNQHVWHKARINLVHNRSCRRRRSWLDAALRYKNGHIRHWLTVFSKDLDHDRARIRDCGAKQRSRYCKYAR